MANNSNSNTSTNWCIPGTVMKSALIKNKLSVCCVNCQSICARALCKIEELRLIVKISNVDILCVSETWLNENIDNSIISIDGYNIVRHDRVGLLGGGVLIYIKNGITCNLIMKSNNQFRVTNTEFITIEVLLENEKILLTALYNPPEIECNESLEHLLLTYGSLYNFIYFLGDFNTNLLVNSPKSDRLRNVLSTHSVQCLGSEPTFFHRNGASLLDLILTNDASKVLRFNQIEVPVLSNHDLVFASLDFNHNLCPRNIQFREYNAIQFDSLIDVFHSAEWSYFYNTYNSNQKLEFFNNLLTDLHDMFVPIRTIYSKKKVNPWFNSTISREIVNRDLLYKRWKHLKNPNALLDFKRARNKVNELIRSAKRNYFSARLNTSLQTKELWKNVKKLGIKTPETKTVIKFTADEINHSFCRNFTDNHTIIHNSNESTYVERESFYFDSINQEDVIYAMNAIKSNALGLDMLPLKFLKVICPILIEPITHLFNHIVTTSVFPDAWKKNQSYTHKEKNPFELIGQLETYQYPLCIIKGVRKNNQN
ncbi:uncharacterized protein LOC129769796 [Toxorhynchites rutilus septentrionalis]|uniref:uncharacterized protein LOC129769796 n=1 Tax=Toxorhynchites rutilus septentrionalis TaxID=329112 RepID=UPI00247A5CF0|nr:uncharacterized protein LOC129769796 [Toxorhynchites rutilus septentrionalis]XP_055628244.1 uncharacterized protein LOC129769796 [Toxorhynchites rutilus septentrionalis]XP_055628245.1 uncharacterized protein LOC129769796 [Toxorhynchites rutilus septentrionalis]